MIYYSLSYQLALNSHPVPVCLLLLFLFFLLYPLFSVPHFLTVNTAVGIRKYLPMSGGMRFGIRNFRADTSNPSPIAFSNNSAFFSYKSVRQAASIANSSSSICNFFFASLTAAKSKYVVHFFQNIKMFID